MPRIHVIGAPGSGKTTYARRLATARKLPLCHLDEIFHDNSGTAPRKRTESERTEMAAEFAKGKDWISEGASFSNWVNPILKRATEIHIVSPSRTIRIWRQIKRYIRRKFGIEQTTYRETLRGLMRGIKWTWNYDRDTLPVILQKIPKRTTIKKVQI
ncbi:MAG: hypothetical protein IKL14_04745 [Alphaproteobacteria bacterium]|nr:hypothetical protein [Alphaproteobacteria bacterium]